MSSLKRSYARIIGGNGANLNRSFTDDGLIDGSKDMAQDFSLTPTEFWVAPSPTELFIVRQINLVVTDSGNPNEDDYGNVSGPLPKGIQFFFERDGIKQDFPQTLFQNTDLIRVAITFDIYTLANNVRALVHRDIFNFYSDGFLLDGIRGAKFGLRLNDDLSSLVVHECQVKGGLYVNNPG